MTSQIRTFRPAEELPGPIGGVGVALLSALLIVIGMALPGMAGLSQFSAYGPLLIPLLAAVAFLVWINERLWITMAVAGHIMMMIDSTKEAIGPGEAGFIVLGLGGLVLWLVKEVGIHRRRLVETGFDLLLLSFMVVGTVVTVIACVLHGGSLLLYAKEYGPVFDLLLYFPLKKYIRTRQDVAFLLLLFIFVAAINGAYGFMTYRERLAQAVFQWQISASRSNVNESTSMALFVLGTTLYAYANKLWLRLASLGCIAGGLISVLISFSRGPIVAGLFAMMVMIVLVPWRNSRKVILALGLALVVGVGVALALFPQIASSIGQSIANRVLSVASTTSDRSFNARLVESGTLLNRYVRYSPVLGNGFGVQFSFLDPLSNTTTTGVFVHNGYIWSLFKYGIPLALMLMGVLLYPLLRLLVRAPSRHAGFDRALMAGTVGYLFSMLIVHFTSNHLAQVSTTLNLALCWAFLDYIQRARPAATAVSAGTLPERTAPAGT